MHDKRAGAAAVEFAAILPIIVLLLLGAIEASRAIMVEQALQEAAHAACRVYSIEEMTAADARKIAQLSLEQAGISKHSIALQPATDAEILRHMQPVSVTLSVPFSQVAWITPMFFQGKTITSGCTMPADLGDRHADDGRYLETDDDNPNDGHERKKDDDDD